MICLVLSTYKILKGALKMSEENKEVKDVKETKNLNVPIKTEVLDAFRDKIKQEYDKEISQAQVVELLLEGWVKGVYKFNTEKITKISLPL
jgi:hypothetical protein